MSEPTGWTGHEPEMVWQGLCGKMNGSICGSWQCARKENHDGTCSPRRPAEEGPKWPETVQETAATATDPLVLENGVLKAQLAESRSLLADAQAAIERIVPVSPAPETLEELLNAALFVASVGGSGTAEKRGRAKAALLSAISTLRAERERIGAERFRDFLIAYATTEHWFSASQWGEWQIHEAFNALYPAPKEADRG